MLKSSISQLGTVGKLALHELQIAQPRAEGIGGEHAGRDKAGKTVILGCFLHYSNS
jgi:hypothetical protein